MLKILTVRRVSSGNFYVLSYQMDLYFPAKRFFRIFFTFRQDILVNLYLNSALIKAYGNRKFQGVKQRQLFPKTDTLSQFLTNVGNQIPHRRRERICGTECRKFYVQ